MYICIHVLEVPSSYECAAVPSRQGEGLHYKAQD